jgi:hypothetical protein
MYNEHHGESIQQTDGQVKERWSLLSQQKFAFPVKLWETRQVSDLQGWEGFTDINLRSSCVRTSVKIIFLSFQKFICYGHSTRYITVLRSTTLQ